MATDEFPEAPTITLSVEDTERLVRKIQALEAVLRELLSYLSQDCTPLGHIAANRMLLELASEDMDEWLREIVRRQ